MSIQEELRALTLWRPWPNVILYGGKRVENRPWKPWKVVMGKYIALHAGFTYDDEAARWMRLKRLYDPPSEKDCPSGCIVGVARVVGYINKQGIDQNGNPNEAVKSPWFFGPYGWLLDNVTPLSNPVAVKGARGLWTVEEEIRAKVRKGYLEYLVRKAFFEYLTNEN